VPRRHSRLCNILHIPIVGNNPTPTSRCSAQMHVVWCKRCIDKFPIKMTLRTLKRRVVAAPASKHWDSLGAGAIYPYTVVTTSPSQQARRLRKGVRLYRLEIDPQPLEQTNKQTHKRRMCLRVGNRSTNLCPSPWNKKTSLASLRKWLAVGNVALKELAIPPAGRKGVVLSFSSFALRKGCSRYPQ
jgi:hypothetical protein